MEHPVTSIIIPVHNQWGYTKDCIDNIKKFTDLPIEIVVIDDASTDGTSILLQENYPDVICHTNEQNVGFSASVNKGIRLSSGEYIVVLNNDTVPSHRWLENMLTVLNSHESIGLVGPLSNYTLYSQFLPIVMGDTNSIHSFCEQFNLSDKRKWRIADQLSGFCLLFRKSLVDEIGYFDEEMLHGYCEDLDYCIRAKMASYHCAVAGDVYVHHWGNRTFMLETGEKKMDNLETQNRKRLQEKWPEINV